MIQTTTSSSMRVNALLSCLVMADHFLSFGALRAAPGLAPE
jgi:hypothetical protein